MAMREYACKMRMPADEYKHMKEGQFGRMTDKYTVDELRGAYLLQLSETLKGWGPHRDPTTQGVLCRRHAKIPAGVGI